MKKEHFVSYMPYILWFVLLSGLTGCGDSGVPEVKQWMEDAKKQIVIFVPKLAEPKKFTPFIYSGKSELDPYNPGKLAIALAKLQARSSNGLKRDLERPREALEAYPLDAMKMVGTLQKSGVNYALLQVDKLLFQVKVGSYLGENWGVITHVSEQNIEIKEVMEDASGTLIERKAKLELQETHK